VLAVIDHVEPDLRLPLRDLLDGAGHTAVQKLRVIVSAQFLAVENVD
jgi:hypothetical protein